VYAREIAGRELTFGVSGKLIMNALVMYDRQTDSLWSQFLGVAVRGDLKGQKLEPLAATLTEWASWRQTHPDTVVLDQGGEKRDTYTSYYRANSAGVIGRTEDDDRLGLKEFVLGLQLDQFSRAYPYRTLNDEPVVNDRLGETDLVVVFDREAGSGLIFDRLVDGRALTFEAATDPNTTADPALPNMRDSETGTLWSGVTGEAIEGPLAGQQLRVLPSFQVFWFAWADFHVGADIYEPS
jgi:hypothetical protein